MFKLARCKKSMYYNNNECKNTFLVAKRHWPKRSKTFTLVLGH